ncbi:hypothetical protein F511_28175 [Dorcoceras hygrometricum]|uniref:glutaminase n=1 Tax=Dorcoceras hygrometricum TaxID=472368 RepID=A0A2Z7BRF7_9LAMI|nr:hypothetical protein F511_28175 [Dorcoceras hygrometricum]
MTVGVLALQGSFNEHIAGMPCTPFTMHIHAYGLVIDLCGFDDTALKRLGVTGVEVRKAEQLQNVSALIIPGGESTTMAKLAGYHNLFPALREFVKNGKPVWGTCAGLIFLADKAIGQKSGGQELIGGLNCTVHRNFFGSQLQSFESEVSVPEIAAIEGGPPSFRGVFIRAPGILEVGPEVQVLADVAVQSDETANFDSVVENSEGGKVHVSEYISTLERLSVGQWDSRRATGVTQFSLIAQIWDVGCGWLMMIMSI